MVNELASTLYSCATVQDGSRRALASDGMGSGYRIYLRSMSSLQTNGM